MLYSFKSLPRYLGALAIASGLMLGAANAFASDKDNPPEISDKISTGLQPLTALYDAKKWDEAIKLIDSLLAKADPASYDRAFLSGYKAQLVFTKGDAAGAVEPLETMLQIGDQLNLFRFARVLPINEQDTLSTLAQLYMQDATLPGKTPEAQRADYAKAHAYGKRLASSPKATVDAQFMWARILYSEATLVPDKIDMTLMKQACEEAQKALLLSVKPKEEHYTLVLAALQQLGDNKRCAELLELMVKLFPNNKGLWQMLFQTYLALQGSDKSADMSAVVTMERAQAAGQMVSNRDNFTLAGLYYNMQQFQFAAELLENGLHNGKIDPEQKNWELLAACYQQMGKDARAIDTFLETIKLFPKSSSLELQLGQLYYNTDKHEDAYKHLQAAVSKGLEKPAQTLVLIAYLALEMRKLDEALAAIEKAAVADPKSTEISNLKKVIQDAIKDRENFKNAK